MDDLIRRQDAIDACGGYIVPAQIIANLPKCVAQPERKTGHWIHCPETERFLEHWSCSVCGHDITENPRYKNFITGERLDFVFCPFCGSQMQKGGDVDE